MPQDYKSRQFEDGCKFSHFATAKETMGANRLCSCFIKRKRIGRRITSLDVARVWAIVSSVGRTYSGSIKTALDMLHVFGVMECIWLKCKKLGN